MCLGSFLRNAVHIYHRIPKLTFPNIPITTRPRGGGLRGVGYCRYCAPVRQQPQIIGPRNLTQVLAVQALRAFHSFLNPARTSDNIKEDCSRLSSKMNMLSDELWQPSNIHGGLFLIVAVQEPCLGCQGQEVSKKSTRCSQERVLRGLYNF